MALGIAPPLICLGSFRGGFHPWQAQNTGPTRIRYPFGVLGVTRSHPEFLIKLIVVLGYLIPQFHLFREYFELGIQDGCLERCPAAR